MLQQLQEMVARQPDKIALQYKKATLTFGQLYDNSLQFAQIIPSNIRGILIQSVNPMDCLVQAYGCMWAGVPFVVSSSALLPPQLDELCEQYRLERPTNWTSTKPEELRDISAETPNSQVFMGVLSSGSSGVPKLIWKDYGCWLKAFPHQTDLFGCTSSDKLFVVNALGYSANLNAVLHHLWQGGTCYLSDLAEARNWVDIFQTEAITSTFLVPSHLALLTTVEATLPLLESIVTAGEKLLPDLAKCIISIAPNALLTEYYGASELGHITYHQNDDIWLYPTSVGKPFPQVSVQVENHQLIVESPYISPDFRSVKTVHDIGFFQEGRLILMGRAGRMFNRRGLNVYAEEIEQVVRQFPLVKQAVLIEVPDSKAVSWKLFYETYQPPSQGIKAFQQQLKLFLLQKLPAYKQPRTYQWVENLPRTAAGKIDFIKLKNELSLQADNAKIENLEK